MLGCNSKPLRELGRWHQRTHQ